MFPKTNPSTLTQRALTGLRLCRSFLMLEDDDAVDWEVGWTERAELAEHPHRAALRERRPSRRMPRRPGQPSPAVHACASPIRGAAPRAGALIAQRRRRRHREMHR
ncbi:MAG: hypothetical protein E6G34_14490 [Actinobacteria bacterium]|nr:MAG: hypothetical protein E6G34_14490 [Actinomycetota bacterium]